MKRPVLCISAARSRVDGYPQDRAVETHIGEEIITMADKIDFVFRVEGLRLSTADQARIAGAVRAAVEGELARNRKSGAAVHVHPEEWKGGMWAVLTRGVDALKRTQELQGINLAVQERRL
jgi:hypothetical protein